MENNTKAKSPRNYYACIWRSHFEYQIYLEHGGKWGNVTFVKHDNQEELDAWIADRNSRINSCGADTWGRITRKEMEKISPQGKNVSPLTFL